MNILLAEDEKAMSMAISAVLTHSGYTVDTVQNGAEAVEAAAQKPYDCLIFDIMMPIKDGVTALSEIRQSGNETPAIFLTAKSEVDDRIMGLDAGADDYLTKPFAMGELLARIRSMTRRLPRYVYCRPPHRVRPCHGSQDPLKGNGPLFTSHHWQPGRGSCFLLHWRKADWLWGR